ncbi:MAG: 4-hydroxy-3-methylbut-2-enyl diphosphate reductase [Proteobacteria bacterium]|nr:4-hydroxy-3-methylbut-2-enyl diphosphate reductase [Pseudomonadota bacterium]
MRILLASPRGFCAGVDRAIEIVERALSRYGPPVYVRHEIVHNRHVVNELRAKGAVFVEDPAEVPREARLVYSAHGVSPAVRQAADDQSLSTLDATCPLVTKVHNEVRRMAADGYHIVMIGHRGHVEVEGTMGQAPDRMHLVESVADVEALELPNTHRLGCVTQTTLSVDDTRDVMDALARRFPAIVLPKRDDICYATQNRQDAVKQLADRAELVLVVGAPESSNSNRLVEVAGKRGARSHLIQSAEDLQAGWLDGVSCVGVTAGASTPEFLVQQVVQRLRELGGAHAAVESLAEVDEGVSFKLPVELRS